MVQETRSRGLGDRRRGSRYSWVADPTNLYSARSARREAQSKLVARYLLRHRSVGPAVRVKEFAPAVRAVSEFHRRRLFDAALELVGPIGPEKSKEKTTDMRAQRLARDAEDFFLWAWDSKKANNANAITAAEFAVQMAYDWTIRSEVMFTLGTPPPVLWWRAGGEQRCWPPHEAGLPISEIAMPRLLADMQPFSGRFVPRSSGVTAFKGLKWSGAWQHDAVRPPLRAVRFAASLVKHQYFGTARPRVLGVELGHSVAAQVLSASLPMADVISCSSAFEMPSEAVLDVPHEADTLPLNHRLDLTSGGRAAERNVRTALGDLVSDRLNADAVVVNLPSLKQLTWFHDLTRRGRSVVPVPMSGQVNDAYYRMRPTVVGEWWWEHLLEYALDQLGPHGLLVVIGDVESGVHVHAKQRLDGEAGLVPVSVSEDGGTSAIIHYKSGVARRLGVLEATGRVVSAWRRMA